jgi:hypothetical protein
MVINTLNRENITVSARESASLRKNMRFSKYSEIFDVDTFFMFLEDLLIGQ